MEVAAAWASAMDFHALSRRELQALCKRNGVRANMTNAAMAEALQALTSVDGIDEIGTTLCLPTPGRSAVKVAGEEQQHGSPLPRGRRVSVKSPEVIRMEVEEGDDEVKRDLVKAIVRTPGLALRSSSRRARTTPAPIPTPATLRRSQRTAARKASAPVEVENRAEEVSTAKRTTGRSARSKMMMDLDQEEEVAAAAPKEEKVQQEEPKAVASEVKCVDPEEEEELTKLLGGDNKEEEPEKGEEADSSDAANGSAVVSDKSCDDLKLEEVAVVVEEEATKPQEGIVEEQEAASVEKSAPLATMEDSPILGVMSKAEAAESVIEKAQDASVGDREGFAEWSPAREMTDEIKPVIKDKAAAAEEEAVKEDGFTVTAETDHSPKDILPAAAAEDETGDDLSAEKEGAADGMLQAEVTDDEISEEDDLDDEEEWASDDDEAAEEINSTDESDCTAVSSGLDEEEVVVQMLQETAIAEEANEDGSAEEDDFTGDLPPEFDNVVVLSDAKTESGITLPVLEENQPAASATKTAVNSLDEFTIKEGTRQAEDEKLNNKSEAVGAKEDLQGKSLRKLKAMYKEVLTATKEGKKQVAEGKRLPLEELDDNASVDC